MPETSVREQRPSAWARMSMERKLPLLIGIFVVTATLAIAIAGYLEVRHWSVTHGEERARSVTALFSDIFARQTVQIKALATAASTHPSIVAYATGDGQPSRSAGALEVLRAAAGRPDVTSAQVRSASGRVLLSTDSIGAEPALDVMPGTEAMSEALLSDSAYVGQFRSRRDSIVYPVAASIAGSDDLYVVLWRRLVTTPDTKQTISKLLGADASLLIGNVDGSLWTDLEHLLSAPVERLAAAESSQVYTRGPQDARYLLRAALIKGTPWMVAVDVPMERLLAPVNHFMRQMMLVASIILLLGLVLARRASRGISEPLTELTTAATAIARGDYSHDVRIARSDELGRLGEAFGTMAGEVHSARTALESKVETRTRDLKDTLARLHDAQDTLVRRERLAMLGQLASGVGHELRNPLGVMTNAVYYLRAVLTDAPENVRDYLGILEEQVALSEKIVADLLDFARSKPPTRTPSSLPDIVATQVGRLKAPASVSVSVHIPPDLPQVLVDATQVGQVVLNLLTNAVQAMQGSGMLSVHAHHGAGEVRLDVTDTGPGVPPENLEKVFEPLFTTKARGIGLGLALSRTFARANGGDVSVTSEMGHGAIFHLSLPTVAPEAA